MPAQVSLSLPLGGPVAHGTLRPYQDRAVHAVLSGIGKSRTGLVVSPTGTGKTVIFSELCRQLDDGPILLLAESRPILRQMVRTVSRWTGEDVGLEQAENYHAGQRIIAASRQTLANPMRLEKLVRRGIKYIFVDEAHHGAAVSYRTIFAAFPDAIIVGLTATPDRGDRKALGQTFETSFFVYEIHEAVADGWLVPTKKPPKINNWDALDISGVRKVAGELCESELEALLATVVRNQAEAGVEAVGEHKAIWFCGRVETAHALAKCIDAINGKSGTALAVDGEMVDDQKDEILDGFKASQFQHLINVGICTEGFDCPDAVAAVLTRPYLSRGRFTQACGRVLRPVVPELEGFATAEDRRAAIAMSRKPFALLVNFKFIRGKHTLVCPEDVLGGKYDDEVKELAEKLQEDGEAETVQQALELAKDKLDEAAAVAEQKRRRLAEIAAAAKKTVQADWGTWNPFETLGIEMPDVFYAGQGGGEPPRPASREMKDWLRRHGGVKVPESCTHAQALKLRKTLMARTKARLAVPGQVRWLAERGVPDGRKWTYDHAREVMERMQREGRH